MASNTFNLVPPLLILLTFLTFANTKAQKQDAPVTYLSMSCSLNKTTSNSAFHTNLKTLLTTLSHSNASFYNTTVTGKSRDSAVYGLSMCRGDFPSCHPCLLNATLQLSSHRNCSLSKEAVVWNAECMLRYSNRSFFSSVDTRPRFSLWNVADVTGTWATFASVLYQAMNETARQAAAPPSRGAHSSSKYYATKQVNLSLFQNLYCLAQCTDDLSPRNCERCLASAIGDFTWCCQGKRGGRVLYPSCNVRYELYPFFLSSSASASASGSAPSPALLPPATISGGSGGISLGTIVAIVVPIAGAMLIFAAGVCFFLRRARKTHDHAQEQPSSTEITVESLRFDFSTIEAATNKFSEANKLGEGGFGAVYKGLLPSGQEVAVKRLSKSSGQGGQEFMNEVELVAKLQHKHLVRILGFCLQEEEKILVYEFVPNKSLDYSLFDPEKQRLLDWTSRYKIIGGIARGIQYLHEDSRLKIIHRDIKPSNILLDGDLSPKISDFGMARIFGVDQTQGNTSRVVGTYGYMSPEYAMHGEFSVKSDVYSFGILIFEIISGQKINSFNQLDIAENLVSHAWKLWKDGSPLELMDPTLRESFNPNEVIRCVNIGLLCVQEDPAYRPTMTEIVIMLSSYSVTVPVPSQPSFFMHSGTDPNMLRELQYDQSTTNSSMPKSSNEMRD